MRVLGRVETQAKRRDNNTLEYKAMWPVGERASKWMGCLCGWMIDRTYRPWRAVCTNTVPSQEALTTTSSCWLTNCQQFFLIINFKHLQKRRRIENLCIDSDAGHLIIVAVLKKIWLCVVDELQKIGQSRHRTESDTTHQYVYGVLIYTVCMILGHVYLSHTQQIRTKNTNGQGLTHPLYLPNYKCCILRAGYQHPPISSKRQTSHYILWWHNARDKED